VSVSLQISRKDLLYFNLNITRHFAKKTNTRNNKAFCGDMLGNNEQKKTVYSQFFKTQLRSPKYHRFVLHLFSILEV
jgi:hypothetical protein